MEIESNIFLHRLEAVRRELGIKEKDIAFKMGMTRPNFSMVKRNGNPRYKFIQKLSKVLNVAPGCFFVE